MGEGSSGRVRMGGRRLVPLTLVTGLAVSIGAAASVGIVESRAGPSVNVVIAEVEHARNLTYSAVYEGRLPGGGRWRVTYEQAPGRSVEVGYRWTWVVADRHYACTWRRTWCARAANGAPLGEGTESEANLLVDLRWMAHHPKTVWPVVARRVDGYPATCATVHFRQQLVAETYCVTSRGVLVTLSMSSSRPTTLVRLESWHLGATPKMLRLPHVHWHVIWLAPGS